ncbi:MAG: Flp family type IVb pilin [Chloroflexota bacterium]|nr:Flp family type IVb pilin [Chloroflexota bacterium]
MTAVRLHRARRPGARTRRTRATLGQGVVEYGLILSLSALLALGLLVFAGGSVADVLDLITDAVDAAEGH